MTCSACNGLGYIEYCDPDGSRPYRLACDECGAWQEWNPREAGDDDGVEYADPRDEIERRYCGEW